MLLKCDDGSVYLDLNEPLQRIGGNLLNLLPTG